LRCPYCNYPGHLALDEWVGHLEQTHRISRIMAMILFYEILGTLRAR
jgi:hypothetical protein